MNCGNCGLPAQMQGELSEGTESGGMIPLCERCAKTLLATSVRPLAEPKGPKMEGRTLTIECRICCQILYIASGVVAVTMKPEEITAIMTKAGWSEDELCPKCLAANPD